MCFLNIITILEFALYFNTQELPENHFGELELTVKIFLIIISIIAQVIIEMRAL